MGDTGQYPNFVYGVLFVLVRLCGNLDLFKCVNLTVFDPAYFIHTRVSTIAELLNNLEVFQTSLPLVLHFVRVRESALLLLRRWNVQTSSDQVCCRLFIVAIGI